MTEREIYEKGTQESLEQIGMEPLPMAKESAKLLASIIHKRTMVDCGDPHLEGDDESKARHYHLRSLVMADKYSRWIKDLNERTGYDLDPHYYRDHYLPAS
jgi:hypothetical protein